MAYPLTYNEAKEILLKAKKPENGIQHPERRSVRIFWEDDSDHSKGIAVYSWANFTGRRRYWGGSNERLSQAQRRASIDAKLEGVEQKYKIVDQGRWVYDEKSEQQHNHVWEVGETLGTDSEIRTNKMVVLLPNGNRRLIGEAGRYWNGDTRSRDEYLVLGDLARGGYGTRLILPEAGSEPKLVKPLECDEPRFIPPWVGGHDRDWYDKNVKRFGSFERWCLRWAKRQRAIKHNKKLVETWKSKDNTTFGFHNAVIDENGQLTKASWLSEKRKRDKTWADHKKAKAAEEKAERKRQRAFRNAMKAGDSKKIFDQLDDRLKEFLTKYKTPVNPDGTVTMVKIVQGNFFSFHGRPPLEYKIGTWVEDPKFDPTRRGGCGGGLHFCPTAEVAINYFGWYGGHNDSKMLVVNVDVESMRLADDRKVVSKKCFVVGEADKHGNLLDPKAAKAVAKAKQNRIAAEDSASDSETKQTVEREGSIHGNIDLKAARELGRKQSS